MAFRLLRVGPAPLPWFRSRFLNARSTVHVILCSEGDQVYLFGFSRGAYTARVLAGMVESVRYALTNLKLLVFDLILITMLLGRSATKGKSLTGATVCTFLSEESSRTNISRSFGRYPSAWQMFRETQDGQQPPSLAAAYKKTFSRSADVEIKFIGVW